jgi:hypothetical protein
METLMFWLGNSGVPASACFFAVAVLIVSSRGGNEPKGEVLTRVGNSLSEITREFGPPSVDRLVKHGNTRDVCGDVPVAVRAIEYHRPTSGVRFFFRNLFGAGPESIRTLCLSSSNVALSGTLTMCSR